MRTTNTNRKLIHHFGGLCALLLVVLLLCPTVAHGVIISVDPANQTIPLGAPVSINVAIAGLGSGSLSLGAFDFNLSFDPSLIAFNSITFGDPAHGDQLAPLVGSITGSSFDSALGYVHQYEISLDLAGDLNAMQPGAFILTSLTFTTIGVGNSSLRISDLILGDAYGNPLTPNINNGTIRVVSVVPEPSTYIAGFSALGMLLLGFKFMKA